MAPDGRRFVLGADWSLRLFDQAGKELWRRPVPGAAWAVNVSGDGRLVVAAYGDGTIRWHRLSDGEELLALYPHAGPAALGAVDARGLLRRLARRRGPDRLAGEPRPGRGARVLHRLALPRPLPPPRRDRRWCSTSSTWARRSRALDREAGGTKAPEKPVAQNLPPVVHITDPTDLAAVDGGDVIVSFEAEAADPVRNVMALVNGRLALRQPRQETAGGG